MQGEEGASGLGLLGKRLANILGKPFGINPFPRAFPPAAIDQSANVEVFDAIYVSNFWGSAESPSGAGSEVPRATRYLDRLRTCLTERGLRSVFDAPCGDLNWIKPLADDPAFDYCGGDIARSLVADLNRRYPDISVEQFDICASPFPDADVWHCRDCLFHLPFTDIRRALENFARSSIPFALLTTHSVLYMRNLDVPAGGFRYLDLERAPIGLPRPLEYLRDFRLGLEFPRYVGLWTREQIAGSLLDSKAS